MRLNRYLARCGLCSRRQADVLIAQNRVRIRVAASDNEISPSAGYKVQTSDVVYVDNKAVQTLENYTWIVYHKPRGLMCSRYDSRGRDLIYEHLDVAANVQSVGRLDMDSEGLLLLTNNGDAARALTLPANAVPRCYRVRVQGIVNNTCLQHLRQGGIAMGISDNGQYAEYSVPWKVQCEQQLANYTWLRATLYCGRWREIRRTLDAVEHPVRRLIRVSFGNIKIGNLAAGNWRHLTAEEIESLPLHM